MNRSRTLSKTREQKHRFRGHDDSRDAADYERKRAMKKDRCYICNTDRNLQEQLFGFWFCFYHVEDALEKGSSYWRRLYDAMNQEHA